jgi:competence protein ComEC
VPFYTLPFAFVTPVYILGLFIGSFFSFEFQIVLLSIFSVLAVLIGLKMSKSWLFTAFLGLAFVTLGAEIMSNSVEEESIDLVTDSAVVVQIIETEENNKLWKKSIGRISNVKVGSHIKSCSEKVLLYSRMQFKEGQTFLMTADFTQIQRSNNPGAFDFQKYWLNKEISKMAFVSESDIELISYNPPSGISALIQRIRSNLSASLDAHFTKAQAEVAKALLLGDKSMLSTATKKDFSNAGVMHILAVSGLHVGIVMFLLMFLLGKFSRFISKPTSVVVCIFFVWLYACITGFSPSVVRAALMFSLVLIAQLSGRGASTVNVLFFSAFVVLLFDPLIMYDVGFQLSYAAVFGIVLLHTSISRLIFIPNKWLRKLWEGTAVGIAAQFFTFPLVLYYFHQFPNYFMLSNIGVMIIAGSLLGLGLLFFVFKSVFSLTWILVFLLGLGINILLFFIEFIADLPGATATGFAPTNAAVLYMYGIILFSLAAWKLKITRAVPLLLAFGMLVGLQWDRYQRMLKDEFVIYNCTIPVFSFKKKNSIVCFYYGEKKDLKKARRLMQDYARVMPGLVRYHKLMDGSTQMKDVSGVLNITCDNGDIGINLKNKKYAIRSRYFSEISDSIETIDLPYLPQNRATYNLGSGAYLIDL